MDDSDLSSLGSLSPPPPSEPDVPLGGSRLDGNDDDRPSPSLSPAPSSDESDMLDIPASPSRDSVLADNPDIAFIVMFRSRFNEAFTTKLGHFGPQDIERGVVDPVPSPQVESLLCALLALVLNRKKPIERGHYGRALEEAILAQRSQWPRAWKKQNPLSGSRTFTSMEPAEKLTLLKTLILWSLHASEVVSNVIKESYKQSRNEYDLNQPLAVQPWGADGKRRIYWLVEGQDDTSFRIYTDRRPGFEWRSAVGSIEEMQALAKRLRDEDGAQAARRLADRIDRSVPRFEATEEKRKRREYRLTRRAQFTRPEPGFSLYEGRTRGKRMRYTFEEEEDEYTSDMSTRRSARNTGTATPAEGPTVTASGRQVRPRLGGRYGEIGVDGADSAGLDTPASAEYERSEKSEEPPAPSAADADVKYIKPKGRGWKGWAIAEDTGEGSSTAHGYNEVDAMDEDEDEAMSSGGSVGEWDGGDDESDVIRARDADDEEDDMDESEDDFDAPPQSLLVTLKYGKKSISKPDPDTSSPILPKPQQHAKPAVQIESPLSISQPANAAMPIVNTVPTPPLSNGFAPSPQLKAEAPFVTAPSPTIKLASHPSPTKSTPLAVKPDAPSVATPIVPSPLANGSSLPPQYRQQTLSDMFAHTPSTPGSSAPPPVSSI